MTRRGTSNTNSRGSAARRRVRKQWLLDQYGDGTSVACMAEVHHELCPGVVTFDTMTVGRIVPGCDQGRYVRDNIRPEFGRCNSRHGGRLAHRIKDVE